MISLARIILLGVGKWNLKWVYSVLRLMMWLVFVLKYWDSSWQQHELKRGGEQEMPTDTYHKTILSTTSSDTHILLKGFWGVLWH